MRKEAEILREMANAPLDVQRTLMVELNEVRAAHSQAVQDDRDTDIANAIIRDTLTPVIAHERTTTATDWLGDVEASSDTYDHAMRTEATLWFRKVSAEVKADRDEFAEQAMGVARRESGRFGESAEAAYHSFLETVGRLYKQAAGDSPGQVDVDQSGNAESTVTDYDTRADQDPMWSEDYDGEDDTGSQIGSGQHPEMPGASGSDVDPEPAFDEPSLARLRGKEAMDHLEKHWYSQGYDRGAGDRTDFAASEGINPDDYALTSGDFSAEGPLSGEMAGMSIPEIFGSWDNATDEARDAYEEGYEDGFQGNTRQAGAGSPKGDGAEAPTLGEKISAEFTFQCDTCFRHFGRVTEDDDETFPCPNCDGTLRGPWQEGHELHETWKSMASKTAASPEWLRERNNDGYGTPPKHPFWDTVEYEEVNGWRIFERDGSWFGHKMNQNAWTTPRPSLEDVLSMAAPENQIDVWGSQKTAVAEVLKIKRQRGVAGQFAYSVQVQYEGEDPMYVNFYGNEFDTNSLSVIMEMNGDPDTQTRVTDPYRFGEKLNPSWVRSFFKSASKTAATCSCARHGDGSVTTSMCPLHADEDPCYTMALVTGKRRKGSIINGVCSNCGWTSSGATASKTAEFGGPGGLGFYEVGDLVVLTNGSVGIYDGEVSQVASYVVADGDRLVVPNTEIDRKYTGDGSPPSFVSQRKTATYSEVERGIHWSDIMGVDTGTYGDYFAQLEESGAFRIYRTNDDEAGIGGDLVYSGIEADRDAAAKEVARWIAEYGVTASKTAGRGKPGESVLQGNERSRAGNYSQNPTKNVTVLPDVYHCRECGKEIKIEGTWPKSKAVHADGSEADHYVSTRTKCFYCNSDDPNEVKFRQHAWYDATECSRCGGVWGRALGD